MIRMDKLCYLARNKLAFGTGSSIMLLVFIPLNTEKRDMIFQFKFMEIPSIPIRKGFSFHSPSKFKFDKRSNSFTRMPYEGFRRLKG